MKTKKLIKYIFDLGIEQGIEQQALKASTMRANSEAQGARETIVELRRDLKSTKEYAKGLQEQLEGLQDDRR